MGRAVTERRNRIAEFVVQRGTVTFAQLKGEFPDASEMTLRTDLRALDQDRRIVRIHGGAKSVEEVVGTDGLLSDRSRRNVAEKDAIAQKAAGLVRPNSTIFLDSGSTTTALAAALPNVPLQVFTNSLTCAVELARLSEVSTIVVGGALNRYSLCLSGGRVVDELGRLAFDQAFLGTTCYDETGFSCGSDEDARIKRLAAERARQTVMLMDSSKVGRRSTFSFLELSQADVLVSDGRLPEGVLSRCSELGVTVL